ncbi:uncharacterized protein TRIADDRAFT_52630 [Trichoplax adhaerens]|uniref:Ig-like domain-containing protein n=1 Tax=Trichoplax adhaerens TaxID=10228 RepID=B3RJH7_TRIAD|nr:hypothetical protein TRIADDRAFT_52630 [Trichoplax adhaerens]EDV29098.1 hypothetical protein TRIADDRAFT_52630 [Trichoplax adhaerens]|eukprot:XP_002108300.1 hypothetical protein TRIADDRAFT_52630 [Trichoplax adhaerens]
MPIVTRVTIQPVGSTNYTLSSFGGNATLSCSFSSNTSGLTVVWTRNNVPITFSQKYEIITTEENGDAITSNLTITNSNITDAGLYTCRATDQSQVSYSTIVSILVKPLQLGEITDFQRLVVGSNASITCRIQAYPLPTLTWRKGNVELSNKTYNVSTSQYNMTTTLSLANLNYTDRSLYSCIFMNEAGNHTETVDIRVMSNLAPLWPALGIICELALAAVAYLTYHGRKAKL